MPLVECVLIKGYNNTTRKILAERITDAACSAIGASPEFVTVTISEVDSDNYMRGRTQRTPSVAPMQPDDIVRAFLTAMEERDLGEAQSWLADGFTMTFPGGNEFTQLSKLVDWAKSHYQNVSKTFDGFEVSFHGLDATVYCRGTLYGVWCDGSAFNGIRFIDRFTITDGKITSQQVWNDLAEGKAS